MMKIFKMTAPLAGVSLLLLNAAFAQTPAPPSSGGIPTTASSRTAQLDANAPANQSPASVSVYFGIGSSAIRADEVQKLDQASRIFNDGKPIVMIITGMADPTGAPATNLLLSQKRADMVFAGLLARGLPANHFQILAKGASDSLSDTQQGVNNQEYRKVEITWR